MGAVGKLTSWRRSGAEPPGSDLSAVEQLDLIDITLITGAGAQAREVNRLGLRFDANGLAVKKPSGEPLVQIPWVSLRHLKTTVRESKGAAPRVELDVESDRKKHRFVVPNVSAAALSGSLGAMSARYAHVGIIASPDKKGARSR